MLKKVNSETWGTRIKGRFRSNSGRKGEFELCLVGILKSECKVEVLVQVKVSGKFGEEKIKFAIINLKELFSLFDEGKLGKLE